MTTQPVMTAKQQQEAMLAGQNPTACMAYAWFYAFMNAQKETADLLQSKFDEIGELVASLRDAGHLSDEMLKSGPCSMDVQRFLNTTPLQDVRVERLRALTNLRFMVEASAPEESSPSVTH